MMKSRKKPENHNFMPLETTSKHAQKAEILTSERNIKTKHMFVIAAFNCSIWAFSQMYQGIPQTLFLFFYFS